MIASVRCRSINLTEDGGNVNASTITAPLLFVMRFLSARIRTDSVEQRLSLGNGTKNNNSVDSALRNFLKFVEISLKINNAYLISKSFEAR